MIKFGASFSAPYARDLGVDPKGCLTAALEDLCIRRLRLMSYWNQIEAKRGKYDFKELDWQIALSERYGAEVTLCLGLRQPRWPESHWPEWALGLPREEWQPELLEFIETVVNRYRGRKAIVSYQLENEAFNRSFGVGGNFDRERLVREFELVKSLDPHRPVIMSTSNSWGIPLFGPRAELYGFSIYRHIYKYGKYRTSRLWPGFFGLRAAIIKLLQWRGTFIHELQAEPWGPNSTQDMSVEEQYRSMNPKYVRDAIEFASRAGLYPIDLWGLEWWYWLKVNQDEPEIWEYMRSVYGSSQ